MFIINCLCYNINQVINDYFPPSNRLQTNLMNVARYIVRFQDKCHTSYYSNVIIYNDPIRHRVKDHTAGNPRIFFMYTSVEKFTAGC